MKRTQIESEGLLKSATRSAASARRPYRGVFGVRALPMRLLVTAPAPVKVIAAGDRPDLLPADTVMLDNGVLVTVGATGTVDVRWGDGVTTFETGDRAGILAGAGHLAVCGGSSVVLDCRGGDVRRVGRVTGVFSRVTAAGVCVGHSVVVTGDEAGRRFVWDATTLVCL